MGTLSKKNLERIQLGDLPKVDAHWINNFPEHHQFIGQKLEHHHIDHDYMTYPLPEKLHRGQDNTKTWHNNQKTESSE